MIVVTLILIWIEGVYDFCTIYIYIYIYIKKEVSNSLLKSDETRWGVDDSLLEIVVQNR